MQRIAFTMKIKPGTEEEYRRRHQQVWPELLADLNAVEVPEKNVGTGRLSACPG